MNYPITTRYVANVAEVRHPANARPGLPIIYTLKNSPLAMLVSLKGSLGKYL